ncbi:DUF2637 domain-containing protein [Streptomyces sp. NPDC127098]|uniref:DUF2637 domain-containing protein n=1 Tax=Streptomyces sp. NPDC127098 TaxID=3347137 RepID=UPI00365B4610
MRRDVAAIQSAERALNVGTWAIVCGAMLYSVLTVTPLMLRHTPAGWELTAPILPIVVDAAVVIVVRLDSVLARLEAKGGAWPLLLRWMTGLMTLGLNTADSALKADPVGVAVHSVAPLLLIVTAETSLAYRRAIAAALARIDAEERAERERERSEQQAREQAAREEREREQAAAERREQQAREQAREEREHAARLEAERADREAARLREEREHAARMERERLAHQAAREREAREHADRQRQQQDVHARQEAARREQERQAQARHAANERREQQAPRPARPVVHEQPEGVHEAPEPATDEQGKAAAATPGPGRERAKMPETMARKAIVNADPNATVRDLAHLTGWSVGWVSARLAEARATTPAAEPAGVAG